MGNFQDLMEYITFWNVIKFILCSGVVVEFVPAIKLNPLSSLLKWIGKRLFKNVEEKFDIIEKKVDTIQTDLQDHKVESWRRDILDFSNSLMLGKKRTKEDFDNIVLLHDRYEKYIIERGLENGQINLAYLYVSNKYKECQDNNGFYTGK